LASSIRKKPAGRLIIVAISTRPLFDQNPNLLQQRYAISGAAIGISKAIAFSIVLLSAMHQICG